MEITRYGRRARRCIGCGVAALTVLVAAIASPAQAAERSSADIVTAPVRVAQTSAGSVGYREVGRGSVAGVHGAQFSGPIVKILVNMVMDLLKVYGVEAAWDRSDSKLSESKRCEVGLCCRELLWVSDAEFVF